MKTKKTSLSSKKSIKNKALYSSSNSRLAIAKSNLNRTRGKSKKFKLSKKVSKRLKKIALVLATVFVVAGVIIGLLLFSWLQRLNKEIPTTDEVFPNVPVASEIYDRTELEQGDGKGTLLYRQIDAQYNSDPVNIKEIPEYVKWAFISAEDEDFYNHKGFDPAAILRCGINYVKSPENVCGGSTITQQLVKITTDQSQIKLERKVKEVLLSVKVEQSNSKDEILQMYLQVTPFGSTIYGVNTASRFYFDKDPEDLTLAEAAILAAVIQNPSRLSPTKGLPDPETAQAKVKERQLYILGQMENNMNKINEQTRKNYDDPEMDDVITQEMIDEARNQELAYKAPVATDKKAGHFVDYVLTQLTSRNYKNGQEPFTNAELGSGGYKIYTTLDYNIQRIAEDYTRRAGDDYTYWNAHNAALMSITPSNGQIISMVGSKNFYGQSEGCDGNGANCLYNPQVNVLTSLQSPGSTNKPMGYYMAYKDARLFPGSFLPDIPIQIGSYTPKNWNGGFNGINYTAEQAIRDSRNIPAIEVIELVGVDNYVNTAREFGYTSYSENYGHSVILGGTSVYPVEHAQAYGIFANGGDFVQLDPILKIEDKDGNVIYQANPQRKQVADPQGVYLLNQSLKNYDGFSWDQRDVAGKTGTSEENIDNWFVGYSPDFVTVGWVGNNNNLPMAPDAYPVYTVTPWVKNYMRDIGEAPYFSAKTSWDANRPGFVYEGGGDCNDAGECQGLSRSWMIVDRNPERTVIKKRVQVCRDQRDRLAREVDIALGLAEEVDATYYKSPVAGWQNFLDEYMRSKNAENSSNQLNGGPQEYCNIDRSGTGTPGPFFNVAAPTTNQVITGGTINIRGSVFTTNGNVTALSFFLDGQPIGNSTTFVNFDVTLNIASLGLENGTYTLRLSATDSNAITRTQDIRVIIGAETSTNLNLTLAPSIPSPNQVITATYSGPAGAFSGVQVYQLRTRSGNTTTTLLGNMSGVGTGPYTYNWAAPADRLPGDVYAFVAFASISGSTGVLRSPNSASVTIP